MAYGQEEALEVSAALVPQGVLQRHVVLLQVQVLDGLQIKLQTTRLEQKTIIKLSMLWFSPVPSLQRQLSNKVIYLLLNFMLLSSLIYFLIIFADLFRINPATADLWPTYLRATDNDANQRVLVGSCSFHSVVQASGEVELRVLGGSYWGTMNNSNLQAIQLWQQDKISYKLLWITNYSPAPL